MNDMNFFAPLQINRSEHRHMMMPALLVLILIMIIAAPLGAFGYELLLKSQIASMQQTLSLPENQAALQRLDQLQGTLDTINQSVPSLQNKDIQLEKAEWITEENLQIIIDTLPKQISATVLSMGSGAVQLDGVSVDKPAIAEMEYNLRKSGITDAVFISSVTALEDGTFSFTVNFTVKGVAAQ